MSPGGPGGGRTDSDETADRSVYSANRERSGSRLRMAAVATAAIGAAIVGFTVANLYVPETANPAGIDPAPVVSLGTTGVAGVVLVLFSILVYMYAYRAGI